MEENTKLVLPAIAVRGVMPLPNNELRIEVGRQASVLALDSAEKMYGGNVILLIQKDSSATEVTVDNLEPIAVLGIITLKLKLPNNNYRVKFKIIDRVKINEYASTDPYFVVNYEKIFSILKGDEEEAALLKNIASCIARGQITLLNSTEQITKLLQSGTTADVLSDVIAYQLKTNTNMSKYRYLEELKEKSKSLKLKIKSIRMLKNL